MKKDTKFSQEIEKFKLAIISADDFSDKEILKLFEMKILYLEAEDKEDLILLFELMKLMEKHRPNTYKKLLDKYLIKKTAK